MAQVKKINGNLNRDQLTLRALAAEAQELASRALADWMEALEAKHPDDAEYGSAAAVLALAGLAGDFAYRVGLTAEMIAQACTQAHAAASLLAAEDAVPEPDA